MSGTRARVTDVLDMLVGGADEREIAAAFQRLSAEDVRACRFFAAPSAAHPVVAPA